NIDIAIFGVKDDRRAIDNEGCSTAIDSFREKFYQLHEGAFKSRIVDLGDIKAGHSVSDTYMAVSLVVAELVKQGILPIIIGGGQDLTYPQYVAYEHLEQKVELVVVDKAFDLHEVDEGVTT